MRTIFVSGADTDVGKTWVAGLIARFLANRGESVQVVKPVETGVGPGHVGDVERILQGCDRSLVSGFTLQTFSLPIAPVAAAANEGISLVFSEIASSVKALPSEVDWRIVEGAGSLATPISEDGRDWSDLAMELEADAVVLVVENRVGAIGQAQLVYRYAAGKGLPAGIWLNEVRAQDMISRSSSLDGIEKLGLPVWGSSDVAQERLESLNLVEL